MPISDSSSKASTPSSAGAELANTLSTTASKIANSNPNRKGLTIYNSLSVIVYIDITNAVASSNFMMKLQPDAFYEMPFPLYAGEFWAVTASGTGSFEVRELT